MGGGNGGGDGGGIIGQGAQRAWNYQSKKDPFRNSYLSPTRQINDYNTERGGGDSPPGEMYAVPENPTRPTYAGIADRYGALGGNYRAKAQEASLGEAGRSLVNRATSTSDSPWLSATLQQQGLEEKNALGGAAQQSASQTADARSQLAMRGGLSGGARERLAASGAQSEMMSQQGILGQGAVNRLGLRTSDEQTKMGLLGQAAGMETGLRQFNAGQRQDANRMNVMNAVGDNQSRNSFDMGLYQEGMKENAAIRGANATAASAPKKSPWWQF